MAHTNPRANKSHSIYRGLGNDMGTMGRLQVIGVIGGGPDTMTVG